MIAFMLAGLSALLLVSGCGRTVEPEDGSSPVFESYRDIPGVTDDEINAIEALKGDYGSFVYGMPFSTEAFDKGDGEVGGYSVLFADWLSGLFDMPFEVVNCEWVDTLDAFETGRIHFNGSMIATDERVGSFFQTSAIAQRSIVYFRLGSSRPVAEIMEARPVRIGILENTASANLVVDLLQPGSFEAVSVTENTDVYALLQAGEIDAYAHSNTTEFVFDCCTDVVVENFYPLTFTPVSLTAHDPALAPVISVVDKALRHDSTRLHLTRLYNEGYDEYRRQKFLLLLTEEEHAYIRDNPVVKTVMQADNYPLSFYDERAGSWQGIAFDILREVGSLAGLSFQTINDPSVPAAELFSMLEEGEASLLSGLIRTPEREGRFIWAENANMISNYALLSKSDFRDIRINEILGVRVGLLRNSAHTEMFRLWFPYHTNNEEYDSLNELIEALDRGEIDVIMQSESQLTILTNYRERPDFKANLVFDSSFKSSFGFNGDEAILRSIVDKAHHIIDTDEITRHWMSRTYDYRARVTEAQRPLLIGLSATLFFILALLTVLFLLNRRAHRRARLILDATPLCANLWNRKMVIFETNDGPVKLFGLKNRQEYLDRFHDLSPAYQPDGQPSHEKAMRYVRRAFDEGKCVFEWMHQKLDGTPIPTEITLVRVKYENRDIVAGYTRDLREYKQMMGEIERRLLLLDATPLACRLWNRDLQIFECNEEAVRLFQLADKREYIERYDELYPEFQPDGQVSLEKKIQVVEKAFEDGQYVFEFLHCLPDGTPLPCEVTLIRLPYGDDYVVAGYTRDLREQKRMQAQIEEAYEHTGVLLNATPIGANLWNEANEIFDCNEASVRLFQMKSKKDYLAHFYDFLPEFQPNGQRSREMVWNNNQKAFRDGTCVYERMHRLPDGTSLPTEVTLARVAYQGGHAVAGYIRDLREHNKMMEEINEITQSLHRANAAKSDFLANMSHEMRTPLNAVIGLSELALEDGRLTEELRRNLENIYGAGDTLLSLVNDILDISKIEAGRFELALNEYDTPSLINDTIVNNILRKEDKPIEFVLTIDETLPAQLYGDELRLKQVLSNLLSNAFKYTKAGKVELCVEHAREGETVWLTAKVKDTGIGIKPEDIGSLFSNYTQMSTKANRKVEGTGLGLPIARKMAEMMDGKITVESEYGKGSIFTVRVKQKYVTDAVIGPDVVENLKSFHYADQKRKKNAKLVRIKLPYAKVLVVDDNVTNLDVAKGLLKPYGMQIDCVNGGQQAIDAIRDERVIYNAIFMDHMMPGMDGIEAVDRIREIGTEYAKNVPIIALTANAIVGNEQLFLGKGFQAFLTKPIDLMQLDAAIRQWVRDKGMEDEKEDKDNERPSGPIPAPSLSLLRFHIDGIDLEKGLNRVSGDEQSYLQILRSYAANTRLLLDSIQTVTPDILSGYGTTVHGIKGSSYGICAQTAGEKAEALENAAKAGDIGFVNAHNLEFIGTVEALLANLDDMLEQIADKAVKPRKNKPDRDVLVRLLEACKIYDMDTVEEAVAELEGYEYDSGGELVLWLWENVQRFNLTEIIEKLSSLLV
jgi:signal transduction histidine kinase/ABC-type amino acid transport substrate-binding protein/FixJ family two-component response regulator